MLTEFGATVLVFLGLFSITTYGLVCYLAYHCDKMGHRIEALENQSGWRGRNVVTCRPNLNGDESDKNKPPLFSGD